MKLLRDLLDRVGPSFEQGKLKPLYPLYEAIDSFLFSSGRRTEGTTHVRDSVDLKRVMITVVVALTPCVFMALWNTGLQAHRALESIGADVAPGWRGTALTILGLGVDSHSFLGCLVYGALFFVPAYAVCMATGGLWEFIFASARGHEISEGFLVSGLLIPLTLPPDTPLWQIAVGTSFGIVIGKEIFGGVGRNFLNPALTARAYLYFAYPAELTGNNSIWTGIDGVTSATALTALGGAPVEGALASLDMTWWQAFLGVIPGSMGETSTLACLLGAFILIVTGIGSWRVMLATVLGALALSSLLWGIGSDTNAMFHLPPHWHLVVGSLAFGAVYMATDPVSAAHTNTGRWIYGFLIGVMTVLIRVINPAFPEGVMLAVLFGNVFAPLIDYFVVQANIKRRLARHAA